MIFGFLYKNVHEAPCVCFMLGGVLMLQQWVKTHNRWHWGTAGPCPTWAFADILAARLPPEEAAKYDVHDDGSAAPWKAQPKGIPV